MRPPEPVNRFLYILQMRTADGQLFPVFQDNHAAADFHDLDEIDDIPPVNEDKFRRVQFREYLLQAFAHL